MGLKKKIIIKIVVLSLVIFVNLLILLIEKSDLSYLSIVNMNTGPNKLGDAHERKTTVEHILITYSPALTYVQEFPWKRGLHEGAFKNFVIPEHYRYFGNKESGFIYDVRHIDCQRLDLDGWNDRLCLCMIKGKGSPKFQLLCASWHGPYKTSDAEKKDCLRSLLRCLLRIKGDLPLLVGGDFNLESKKVEEVCSEMWPKCLVKSPQSDSIMMWVYTDDLMNTFESFTNDENKYPAFDHDVLMMKLRRSTAVEDESLPRFQPYQSM